MVVIFIILVVAGVEVAATKPPKEPQVPHCQCGPNQEYKKCGSSCEPSCSDLDNPPQACPDVCVQGCFCKDGYLKDASGNCVPRSQCPLPICYKPNEVAKDCGSYCEIRTCEDYKRTDIMCPAVCVRGCFCRKGYVRNAAGDCIRKEKCPPKPVCLQEHEEYQSCGSSCPDNCENYMNQDRICTMQCVPGCNCKPGYVRNLEDGTCIKPEQCPLPICNKPNEVAKDCGSYCENRTCEDYSRTDIMCPAVCVRGCFCRKGYVRNADGDCIRKEKCPFKPVCLQEHEEYQPCGSSCPDNCENYMNPDRICTMQCVPGCNCKQGYVRNLEDGTCIKPEQCQPTCPAGEKWSPCSAHCQDTCENYNSPNRACTRQCQSGCVCELGTVRRKDGQCVQPMECKPTCPAGEKWSPCSAHCQDTCENYNSPNRACTRQCQSGCVCELGTVRRKDGQCVQPMECTEKIICPADEVYDPCSAHCEPTCEYHGPDRACTAICKPGCRCREGLVRRKDDKCVKLDQCHLCPANEVYDPCVMPNCPPGKACAQVCRPGCKCKDGLVRDKNGKCVHPKCPRNERWVNCVAGLCIALSCDQLGYPIACPGIIGPCSGGCVCSENYVRDSNNVCIPKQNCPSCNNDYNATSGCGNHCGRQCTDYKNPPNCANPTPCKYNGCDCKKGYVYNIVIDRCVDPVDCPVPCNGDIYAEKVNCPNPCPATCTRPTTAICPRACLKEGCQCRTGYVLGPDGKCVRPENCPVNLGCNGDPNSQISSCVSLCEPTCGGSPRFCPALCRLGCACKSGFILSKPDGICIKPDKCVNATTTTTEAPCKTRTTRKTDSTTTINKPCSDPNAIRKNCASHESCRATCAVPNSRICPKICIVNGCECKKGYVLSEPRGKCIKIEECPKGNVSCNGDPNAEIMAFPPPCPSTCKMPNGIPGCLLIGLDVGCQCKPGYLKDDNGKCILPDNCKGGNPCGKNATFSWCRVNCPNNECPVEDIRGIIACDPPYPCPSGCVCKLNYRRKSQEDDRCILTSECPRINCTRPNEVWRSCSSPCLRENCEDINNQPTTCNTLVFSCNPKCICKKGYFRNATDICVPAKDCPNNQPCDDPNAERLECAPAPSCRSTCARPNPSSCILSCAVNDCVCKKGFVLSKKGGNCIPVDQCPKDVPCNGDSNAVIIANPPPCPSTCDSPNASYLCRRAAPPVACQCKDGYIQDTDGGKCIKPDKCPGFVPIPCPSTCSAPNADPWCRRYAPPVGCECKLGYLFNDDGKCITPDQCLGGNPCGQNATFAPCTFGCPTNNCPVGNSKAIVACSPPNPCPSGCVCKKGYKRRSSSDGTCILLSDCPNNKCSDPNAERVECALATECRATCANPKPAPCISQICIKNECVCKQGYVLSEKGGKCISLNQCPQNKPCEDPNAERMACAPVPSCRSTCATPNPSPCIEICAINQCVCKNGYVLSTKCGKCIPVDQCPKDVPCNGDSNAVIKANPIPCPSTCSAPNADPWCKRHALPVGCECKPGYLLNDDGKCIIPDHCPGGNPCGQNATFAPCSFGCPTNNCPVSNSIGIVACSPPYPCPSGCVCKKGYKRRSSSDDTCILLSDCPPPIKCKANEVYSPCRMNCPPQTCASIYTSYNCQIPAKCEPGCDCVSEYLRNGTVNDPCIPSYLCPTSPPVIPDCGINEHYETNRNKCELTCKNYHLEPVMGACQATSACFCDDGYVRNSNGLCIPKKRCPQNIVCPPNEVLSECYNSCHTTCKTRLRSDGRMCHLACIETGCLCKEGYMRHDNGTCVPISHCSPPRCNDDETYSKCGTACPPTCQNRGDNCTACTEQCVEDCFCKKGLVRSEDGSCIKPEDCPKRICGSNEKLDPCPPTCPPTDGCSNMWSKFNCTNAIKCCKPQCRCEPGYLRKDGVCIPIEHCLK